MKEGWKYINLLDVCDFQGGSQPPKSEWINHEASGYIRMLQIRDYTQSRNVLPEYVKLTNRTKCCDSEDIMIGRYGASLGKILSGLAGAYNVALMKTIPTVDRLIKPYLKYYLLSNTFQYHIAHIGGRAAQAGFSKDDLRTLLIPLPSLSTQQSIVTYLDTSFSLIDSLAENAKKALENAKALFQAELKKLMEKKEGWEEKNIKDIGNVIGGTTPNTTNPEFWNGTHCWISPAELKGDHYLYDSLKKITDKAIKAKSLKELPIGTVILSSRAPIGKVAINKVPMYCNQGFKCVVCKEYLYNEYLYWWLYGNKDYLNSLGTGATFAEISKTVVENISLFLPPLSEQHRIVQTLDTLSQYISQLEQNYNKTLDNCQALKQALLRETFE